MKLRDRKIPFHVRKRLAYAALDAIREMFGMDPLVSESNALAHKRPRRPRACRACGMTGHDVRICASARGEAA